LMMLEKGKNIVTANKALVANHGAEIFSAARKNGKTIAFEAAVCGGIPILGAMETSLQGNAIQSIHAIVNGTCNYILTQMEEKGTNYADVVREAQRLGYAEADPTLDVDGSDATQKLAILAQLGFGANVDWKIIPKQGIQDVEVIDIKYAKELGYKVRLLAVAESTESGLELHVSPTLVPEESPLADVRNAFNALCVYGDVVGPVFFHGYGAGQMPTASSVVGDIIDTILGRTAITFAALDYWNETKQPNCELRNPNEMEGRSYLRLSVEERVGVLHEVSGVLGKFGISISSMIQHDKKSDDERNVSFIITTHKAKEGNLLQAIEYLSKLSCLKSKPVRMRVL
ncbi:MAG: homoserine dehydrogenase, partial [Thermoguttaceae bacterium]